MSTKHLKAEEGLIGQIIHDRFRIEALLGRGNVGVVYRATDLNQSRQVAVKIIKCDLRERGLLENFNRDAQLIAEFSHPGATKIYEYGSLPTGGGYLVMEFIEGETLRDILKREHQLPALQALKYFRKICEPLAHAHSLGIQHRDLKPENIILPTLAKGEQLLVADFGLVKLKEGVEKSKANLTAAGEVMGTPSYMSPEQCLGSSIDEQTDIYALGIIFYEMLVGRPPFEGNFFVVLQMHVSKQVPSICQVVVDVPESVEQFINSLLQKEKEQRPHSMAEVLKMVDSLEQDIASIKKSNQSKNDRPLYETVSPQVVSNTSASVSAPVSVSSPAAGNVSVFIIAGAIILAVLLAIAHWGLKLV